MQKTYISAQQLLEDSLRLALSILDNGYKPDLLAGVWRGGAPIAIAIQETLALAGIACDHVAIRASSYSGIGKRTTVKVDGLDYIRQNLAPNASLLIIDDVFDTGLSIKQILAELDTLYQGTPPEIRVATPYYKPGNNLTGMAPDYFLHECDQWLVFPHELLGLGSDEIQEKPMDQELHRRLQALLPR